jgi:hypothetical protein
MKDYKKIKTIEDIKEINMMYTTIYCPSRFFTIDYDKKYGYSIYGHVSGHMPTSVCKGENVISWKTFENVKRAIKTFAEKGFWGFKKWFPKEK